MNVLVLLSLLFLVPFMLLLVWLALSSCLGDGLRAHIAGVTVNPRHGSYGRSYAQGMLSGAGQAGWEQIEMEDMIDSNRTYEDDEH